MTHFIVICDYADERMTEGKSTIAISGVAHTRAEARTILANACKGERKYALEHGWTIITDREDSFDACESKESYETDHACFYIVEVEGNTLPDNVDGFYGAMNEIDAVLSATRDHFVGAISRGWYERDIEKIKLIVEKTYNKQEPSDTDFNLIRKLAKIYKPEIPGVVLEREIGLIRECLELSCRNVRELSNLRNAVVMCEEMFGEHFEASDAVSAITSVIDGAILDLGGAL